MSETKHTPGPWAIEFARTGVEWPEITAPNEEEYDDGSPCIVARIYESYEIGRDSPEKRLAIANARLIAASPIGHEIVELLENVTSLDQETTPALQAKYWKQLNKALRRYREIYPKGGN